MTDVLLEARAVTKRFSGLVAVDSVSLELRRGEVHGIIGPNGAGKSTLVGCLAGSLRPSDGSVWLHGEEVTRRKQHVRCRRGLGRTFQTPRPFPDLTVLQNVEIAARFGGGGQSAEKVLRQCGIAHLRDVMAADLTHGQQRRLELARTLATGPDVILLDEVGAGLDDDEIAALDELVRQFADAGLGIVMVEHVLRLVMNVSDRITVLDNGRVIASDAPAAVAEDPAVIEAYLGI